MSIHPTRRDLSMSMPDTEVLQPTALSQLGDVFKSFRKDDEEPIMFLDNYDPRELCFE